MPKNLHIAKAVSLLRWEIALLLVTAAALAVILAVMNR